MILTAARTLNFTLIRFAERQSLDEVARQFSVVRQSETARRVLAMVAFASAVIFLPWGLCLTMFVVECAGEFVGFHLMKTADPQNRPQAYIAMLASYLVSQIGYCVLPVLIWQLPDPFAKAYAVGAMLVTLMHVASIRTVHLPLAMIGAGVVIAMSTLANGWYWLARGDTLGFLASNICLVAASCLAVMSMRSLHRLYDELLREREAAEAADQTKLRFLAQMSHELRTPLNAILGMGNAELSGARSAEQRERLSILVQSARSLSVILDDILDLSAVQAGKLPIRPQVLDLRVELASTVAMFRQQIEDAGLTLHFSVHDQVPHYARLDGQRLRQCLSNILSNAVKHTQAGLISVYAYEHQPGVLAIKVADSGPGVPEEMRDKIFEPFYRGELNVPGTGLGLSIGCTLARRMGGDLALLPSVSGAHFLLTLEAGAASVADMPQAERALCVTLAGMRVLVVDDIATNRLVAATYLRLMGAEPVEAASGAEAVAWLASAVDPAQIVLLDMLMPDMDGAETLRRIRALPGSGQTIAVVSMSADATDRHLQAYKALSFDGHITKPLSEQCLREVLLSLVKRRAAGLSNRLPV